MDHRSRIGQLQASLTALKLGGLLVTHLPNIRYLCGFTGSSACLVVLKNAAIFFTDSRYPEQARAEVSSAKVVIAKQAPLLAAGEWLAASRSKSRAAIGVEAEHLTLAERARLGKPLPSRIHLRPASNAVEALRRVKNFEEKAKMRTAAQLGSDLFMVVLRALRPGVPETEVAAKLEYEARRLGAEGMSFDTIIASGKRSALPHGRASASPIARRGFVVCDFGVILAGYCSDMTRTVHVGRPSARARLAYEAVLEAQLAAVGAVRAGVSTGAVDQAARKVLKKHKLARYFTHSTGHGVGLEIHEAPRVGANGSDVLQAGMVITIEPGIYLPGKWGIRIEDTVVVTETGCEILTAVSKDLIVIE
jgi:Xaa-Pro aminopeptidase